MMRKYLTSRAKPPREERVKSDIKKEDRDRNAAESAATKESKNGIKEEFQSDEVSNNEENTDPDPARDDTAETKSEKNDDSTLSAFERRRLQNIAANKALLKGISNTTKRILPAPKPSPSASSKASRNSRNREPPVKREPVMPTRRSSRVAGLEPDRETRAQKRVLGAVAGPESPREKAKRMRISGDLNLGDALVEGKKWNAGTDGLLGLQGLSRGAKPGLRTFTEEDIKSIANKDLKTLTLRMNGLKLYEHWEPNDIKITPQRVYSLGFHPTEDKPVIFAGDKEGAIGVFDASQDAPEPPEDDDESWTQPDPVISAFKFHTKTATSFVFSHADHNAVYTSSYDSTIRKLDLGKGVAVEIFSPADVMDEIAMSAMEMPGDDPNMLLFSTIHGGVGRHDIRTPTSQHEMWTLSEQKIGGFSLHPRHPHLLATASLDRTMKLWDLRKITGKGDMRHPALLGEHGSRLSVSHAAWSSAGHLATSSYDDTLKLYDFTGSGAWKPGQEIEDSVMEPATYVRHNNQTGRWVTILKPRWQEAPRDGIHRFVIGNMNRFVDVFASDGSQVAQLGGDSITAVPAAAQFHPTMDWVAGGNASGKLTLWM